MTTQISQTSRTSTDTRKWKAFAAAQAPDFSDTAFLSALVTDPDHVGRLIGDSLRTATRRAPGDLRLRAFRPGAFDYRLTKRFIDSPLTADESAVRWLARTVDSREACLAVNDIASWSLPLADWVSGLLREIVAEGIHELPSGTDVYTFVADSGWTPFGIHKDSEPSLIFHLGPSPKEVWVWQENPFDASGITPSPSFGRITFDIEDHLSSAERYVLQPGDFICIPKDTFHVFRNLGPSAFLGLTLYPVKSRSLLTEALWRSTPAPGASALAAYPSGREVAALAQAVFTEAAIAGPASGLPLADRIEAELALGQLRLRTNGYLSRPHPAALPTGDPEDGQLLRWAHPGVVAATRTAAGAFLVVRGRSLPVPDGLDFTALEQATRSGQPFTFTALTESLPAGLDTAAREALARRIHAAGAVTPS
ncbi:cupin domain-containing protein [Streptomyces sp. CB00455]|uniref:cupin domain-containing protein n=1 Tax=Streptomyces sp. CB00455 TaxID=1703927 RepID=UPI00093B663F|nr:cupin domain-containing protein [Streptomyces sp. CB00455]